MSEEIPIHYDPTQTEKEIAELWTSAKAFAAVPRRDQKKYVIMMPLPNVTGALHMGHAMDNVMQDLLIRWHRMMGDDTLWMAGTDHAGIATQAVVEKRLYELEGKTRHDIGREALVRRIWDWKDEYQRRIYAQLKAMGCSCDWDRARFTMDAVCSRAVRHTFFAMFRDGIIYRGSRLVNWDCQLQTAVSDDEIVYETVNGHFWYMRYPVIDPQPGEPDSVVVATTRPETMLGDTAVACHPDPEGELNRLIQMYRSRLKTVAAKEKGEIEAELGRLEQRKKTHLPQLLQFTKMAESGRKVLLPLQNRPIPLIADIWAKPELGTGCVKITPAHDANDYEVWQRQKDKIGIIHLLNPDGSLNDNAGAYAGMDRFAARERVLEDLKAQNFLELVEDRQVEIGHSDRSKTPIEPYLSLQWFVRMGDVEGGVVCGRGTEKEFTTPGLAQAAIDAARGKWRSATGRKVEFHPDPVRYRGTYISWLQEKRDWCISRQLWWGHRIPVWKRAVTTDEFPELLEQIRPCISRDGVCARLGFADGTGRALGEEPGSLEGMDRVEVMVCLLDQAAEDQWAGLLNAAGLEQDPDVLDTWFSSALWPHSTLGWPDPDTAEVDPGQPPLGATAHTVNCLDAYFPGSCLVTARDIITLWVARMIVTGLYNLGDVPFTDVFIHANILDGKGERMSKSKGNGIDPVDIIQTYGTDAMRYVLAELQTGTQDIRLPVQAVSPFTGNPVDLATAQHGKTIFTYICPETGKEFDVLGSIEGVPSAKLISDRFDVGVHFCTKLWNASRLICMNLPGDPFSPLEWTDLPAEDRWILSRLSRAIGEVDAAMRDYNPSAALNAGRTFFWNELCDWYLEMIKPRLSDPRHAPTARQVVVTVLDRVLRLFHPFTPFITEAIWRRLNTLAPVRSVSSEKPASKLLVQAPWPVPSPEMQDPELEQQVALVQDVIRSIRNIRSKHGLPLKKPLPVVVRTGEVLEKALQPFTAIIRQMASLESMTVSPDAPPAADAARAAVGDVEVYVLGAVDVEKERNRLRKQTDVLRKRVEGSRRKLANEDFLAKARPEVVEKEREKLRQAETELMALQRNLEALEPA